MRALIGVLALLSGGAFAQDQAYELKPYTVEYTYTVAWGDFDEFLTLYKKNHWPFIVDALEDGDMLDAVVEFPANHPGEADRWDMRVRITYKDVVVAHGLAPWEGEEAFMKENFPDRKKFMKEEKRRFELLIGHQDVEIKKVDTSDWLSE